MSTTTSQPASLVTEYDRAEALAAFEILTPPEQLAMVRRTMDAMNASQAAAKQFAALAAGSDAPSFQSLSDDMKAISDRALGLYEELREAARTSEPFNAHYTRGIDLALQHSTNGVRTHLTGGPTVLEARRR